MEIGFLVDKSAPQFIGGYETRVFQLARHLVTRNSVTIYTSSDVPECRILGVDFVRVAPASLPPRSGGGRNVLHTVLFSVLARTTRIPDHMPDILIVQSIPYLHLPAFKHWKRGDRPKIVLDVCEAWAGYRRSLYGFEAVKARLASFLLSRALRSADSVLAISNVTAESLVRNYGLESSRLAVVPMGLDLSDRASRGTPALQNGADTRPIDFITVGRLVPIKRHFEFLQALSIIRETYGWNGRAVIIGDGPLRPDLESFARKSVLSDHLDFVGQVSDSERDRLLGASKIFVLSSEREGYSLATLEAASWGVVPVVARTASPDVFGVHDVVTDGVNGRTYPLGEVRDLARVMWETLRSRDTWSALSKSAAKESNKSNWSQIASDLERRLESILSTKGQ